MAWALRSESLGGLAVADHSRDRVEAAAKAMTLDLDVLPIQAASAALAAADEADRVAGVVRVDTRDDATVERLAERVHEAWIASKQAQGVHSRLSESGEELMDSYSLLSEPAKDLDRGTVRAVLVALGAAAGVGEQQGGQT